MAIRKYTVVMESSDQEKSNAGSPAVAFMRHHRIRMFTGLCFGADALLAWRGSLQSEAFAEGAGWMFLAGSAIGAVLGDRAKIPTATYYMLGSMQMAASGARLLIQQGGTADNFSQLGIGLAAVCGTAAVFFPGETAETLKKIRPAGRLANKIKSELAAKGSRTSRAITTILSPTQSQMAFIFNTISSSGFFAAGASEVNLALKSGQIEQVETAAVSLLISALLISATIVVSMKPEKEHKLALARIQEPANPPPAPH